MLKWFGAAAGGCVVGVVVTAAMFLFLASPVHDSNARLESAVAPLVVEPTAPPGDSGRTDVSPQNETGETVHNTTPRWLLNRPKSALPVSQATEAEPTPNSVPTASFARGAPAGAGEQTHLVREGETLWDIAVLNGMGPEEIAARNGLAVDDLIAAGDTLVIPSASQ